MFSSTSAVVNVARQTSSQAQRQLLRSFATAAAHHVDSSTSSGSGSSSTSSSTDASPPPTGARQRTRIQFNPSPRSSSQLNRPQLASHPHLPPHFGQNQLLAVSDSTRALLESIVGEFRAPIRYAFAYGSGIFTQDGYADPAAKGEGGPLLDFIFAVRHPGHWHSINMNQFPSHYPIHARTFGSDFVSRVQDVGPGVWFNTYVRVNDVTIKYGVVSIDALCHDLLTWNTLYLSGRMHKPIRIIKDDPRVRLTQQVNLAFALRAALLTLPSRFTAQELFERITGISYEGDPRMYVAENRGKIGNIVRGQGGLFWELYGRLAAGMPGVHWPSTPNPARIPRDMSREAAAHLLSSVIEQDVSPHARAAHLRKLPSTLASRLSRHYALQPGTPSRESDETAFWIRVGGDEALSNILRKEMRGIVRWPAMIQSAKGLVSAGLSKSVRYSVRKIGKWWNSSSSSSSKSVQ